MELPIEGEMRGAVLIESIGFLLLFVVAVGGAHLTVLKFWNRRLVALEKERLPYDGESPWRE